MKQMCVFLLGLVCALSAAWAQSINSEILGVVTDASGAAIVGAKVTATNRETNQSSETKTSDTGRFRLPQLRPGFYMLTVEMQGFSKYVEGPFELRLNQAAELSPKLQVGAMTEVISVTSEAPVINTTNAEVSTTFEAKRIADVPLAVNRNILNLALNVAGVSQLSSGQQGFASGVNMAVNGNRVRSNNFMIDGQDTNDPSVTGATQGLNNPDVVAEFRVITNQFAAEYGRAGGSVVNIVTKSGTNDYHGSGFWFNNNAAFNTRSNLDKNRTSADRLKTPARNETQLGGTLGGRIIRDKTFFFGSYQRWWDRRLGVGTTINGVPTAAGRAALQPYANVLPVKALLDFLPPGAPSAGITPEQVTLPDGRSFAVERGTVTGSAGRKIDDTQFSGRVDHRISDKNMIGGRYMYQDQTDAGGGQVSPPGYTTLVPIRNQSANFFWTNTITPRLYGDLRLGYTRQAQETTAEDVRSQSIPSIEVNSLGLTGFNAAASRTAIGLAVNLPQFRKSNRYQLQYNVGWTKDAHNFKGGIDFRREQTASFFVPTTRGRLAYNNLTDTIQDIAQATQINGAIRGGQIMQYYNFYDLFFYFQDEWRIRSNFTLTYGIRYELPGNPFSSLQPVNDRIVAANNGDARYKVSFPARDTNNWQPRVGFNYKLGNNVIRGGYALTNDFAFLNIALNIFSAFPFLNSQSLAPRTPNSYQLLTTALNNPITNPNLLTRTNVSNNFHSPTSQQVSLGIQRQIFNDWALSATYIGTRGTGLFQTIDGNPVQTIRVNSVAANGDISYALSSRVNSDFGVIRTRANSASSNYNSLQLSMEKRYSKGLAMGAHYTWSSFIDTASEIFNPAVNGDVAVSQNSFNWRQDRARSTYDRPHRFTLTSTYEVPDKWGPVGKILGGWQLSGFLTMQSGAPFTPLNGTDPFLRVGGIDGLVGNSIRPNVASGVSLGGRTIDDLYAVRTTLFTPVTANTRTVGAVTPGQILTVAGSQIGLGDAGRNIIRADGIGNLDFSVSKLIKMTESQTLQIRGDFYNLTNTRNFGIPESRVNSAQFLNQWGQDGGNRRIQLGVRYVF